MGDSPFADQKSEPILILEPISINAHQETSINYEESYNKSKEKERLIEEGLPSDDDKKWRLNIEDFTKKKERNL